MVFPDGYKFYDPLPTKPKVEESEKSLISSDNEKDAQNRVRVTETPAPAYEAEAPLATLSLTRSRTKELARPKTKVKLRPLDRFFDLVSRQSIVVKGLLVLFLTSIPFIIFFVVASSRPKDYITIRNFLITTQDTSLWLIVCWGSFMGLLYLGLGLSAIANHICTLSATLDRYRGLARAICTRIVLLIWAGAVYALIPKIVMKGRSKEQDAAIVALQDFFKFLMLAFGIILLQGVLLQLIKIQYIEGFIGPRAAKAQHELQVLKELDHLIRPPMRLNDITTFSRILKKLFAPIERTDYYIVSRGEGDEEQWDNYAEKVWDQIAGTKESLTFMDICNQMDRIGRSADKEKARELFDELNSVTDNVITETEVKELVHRVGLQLNRRTQAMMGIKHLSSKLELFTTILTFFMIVFVYGAFFDEKLGKQLGSLWGGVAGLAFAFSGSVAEFVNATVFCFGKHPYDVGDFVEIKTVKYIVSKIYLTHTQFEQVQNEHVRGLVCQMSHVSLQTETITNWTRTVDEAYLRHAEKASASGDKTSAREDAVANLVSAKLSRLQQAELARSTIQ